jgi:hypothetical protein
MFSRTSKSCGISEAGLRFDLGFYLMFSIRTANTPPPKMATINTTITIWIAPDSSTFLIGIWSTMKEYGFRVSYSFEQNRHTSVGMSITVLKDDFSMPEPSF